MGLWCYCPEWFARGGTHRVLLRTQGLAVARAANCLIPLPDGSIRADNTDGIGMVRDMVANLGWQLSSRRVLLLGAGGAVRGVMQPLLMENPAELVVANRTAQKAEALASEFADQKIPVQGCGLDDINGQSFDLIINGTSAGLTNELFKPTYSAKSESLSSKYCCLSFA
ncbi:MAG: hypothetical protein EBY62_05530 [Cellvibrionales bacterium]|nr:hypothetical protein [Cellvibrionales bacterium]